MSKVGKIEAISTNTYYTGLCDYNRRKLNEDNIKKNINSKGLYSQSDEYVHEDIIQAGIYDRYGNIK